MARQFQQEIKELRDSRMLAREEAEMSGVGSGLGSRMSGR